MVQNSRIGRSCAEGRGGGSGNAAASGKFSARCRATSVKDLNLAGVIGLSTTSSPCFSMITSEPENRKARGSRTAWLPPCWNILAVVISIFCIYATKVSSCLCFVTCLQTPVIFAFRALGLIPSGRIQER